MSHYLGQLPKYFQRYVVNIKNVKSDSKCWFRALAVALGENEHLKFEWIRKLMLEEYESKRGYYEGAFDGDAKHIHTLLSKSYPNGRPQDYWMMNPYCAMLLSNALGVIIICLSLEENITCFPFWKGPGELYIDDPICIALVSGSTHFVTVFLDKDCPMPYTSAWGHDKPASQAWVRHPKYRDRLAEYHRHIQANKAPTGYDILE
uniref:uncharacterized protein LOC122610390 n=1 Tax=Erigeron canadensis TaxID=72917 RepID=UPI001CB88E16|nr:uncharacterized protein LOC122610390 [Erigeron canadensis]